MNSLIHKLPDPNAKRQFLDYSHLSDDRQFVYINFVNKEPVPIAKKIHDGTKIVPQVGVYEFLVEALVEKHNDHSVHVLNDILLQEVEKFNQELMESSEGIFNEEISKLENLYQKYLKINVFNADLSRWDDKLYPQINDLLSNKILKSNDELYARILNLKNSFFELQDCKIKAIDYQRLIEQFVENVNFDKNELNKSQTLFEESLTFKLALELPKADPKNILKMLFQRFDYDNKKSEYKLRNFSSIQDMIDAANESNA